MLSLCVGALCILSFTIGAVIGQRVVKNEPIIPTIKKESFRERQERNKELERNRIISENIDNYDGTGLGQQNLPS